MKGQIGRHVCHEPVSSLSPSLVRSGMGSGSLLSSRVLRISESPIRLPFLGAAEHSFSLYATCRSCFAWASICRTWRPSSLRSAQHKPFGSGYDARGPDRSHRLQLLVVHAPAKLRLRDTSQIQSLATLGSRLGQGHEALGSPHLAVRRLLQTGETLEERMLSRSSRLRALRAVLHSLGTSLSTSISF